MLQVKFTRGIAGMEDAIDFVIVWVDGQDDRWRKQRAAFQTEISKGDDSEERYRDWGLLRYWFRGAVCTMGIEDTFCYMRPHSLMVKCEPSQIAYCKA